MQVSHRSSLPCLLMAAWLPLVVLSDIKYVLIGGGIGLLLVAVFIITKICIIRKQVSQNNAGEMDCEVILQPLTTTKKNLSMQ